jgi:hypothetical protein
MPRSALWFPLVVLTLLSLATAPAWSAQWDPLPPEVTQVEDCPNEPGCNAVILRYNAIWDNEYIETRVWHHRVIKILKPEGLDAASVKIPKVVGSWNIRDLVGRTIRADGSVVELNPNSAVEETEVKARGFRRKVLSFQMPGAEVGAILEYRYKLVYTYKIGAYLWSVQGDLPILQATMTIKTGKTRLRAPMPFGLEGSSLGGRQEDPGTYVFTVKRIAALKDEPMMPPEEEARGRVMFYPAEPWWSMKAIRTHYDELLAKYYTRSSKAKKLGRQVLTETGDPEETLALLYRHIQNNFDNTSYRESAEGEVAEERNLYVDDVVMSGQGSHDDLVRLFVFLAKQAGLKAELAYVAPRDESFFRPDTYFPYDFSNELAAVWLDNQWKFYDPGTRYCPVGLVSWDNEGLGPNALMPRPSGIGGTLAKVPPSRADDNLERRVVRMEIAPDGGMTAEVEREHHGLAAASLRNGLDHQTEEERFERLEEALKETFSGATLEELEYQNLEAWEEPLRSRYRLRVDQYGAAAGSRLLMPVILYPERNPFHEETRQQPIYFQRAYHERDEVTITIPEGFEVESLPRGRTVDLSALLYRMRVEGDGNEVRISRDLKVDVLLVEAAKYDMIRNLFVEAARVDGGQLVLRRADEAATGEAGR